MLIANAGPLFKYPWDNPLDIETNPGPYTSLEITSKENQVIATYNVKGMKDHKKLKRITNFCNKQ